MKKLLFLIAVALVFSCKDAPKETVETQTLGAVGPECMNPNPPYDTIWANTHNDGYSWVSELGVTQISSQQMTQKCNSWLE